MKDLISVVVPVYNVEQYLERCIESIRHQTYSNLEIILVDDGSPDNCGFICDEYAKKDSRIKVIHKKNGGLSDARNVGITKASGKYIGFVDSDDWIENTMYDQLYNTIQANAADIAICSRYIAFENGRKKSFCKNTNNIKVFDSIAALKQIFSFKNFDMAAWDKLYKKELFKEIKFPVGVVNEDYYTTPKLFQLSKRIAYIDKPLYNYLQRKNSITKSYNIRRDPINASKYLLEFYEKNYPEISYVAATALVYSYVSIINKYLLSKKDIPKEFKNEYKKIFKKYIKSVVKNDTIPLVKKLQILVIYLNFKVYKYLFLKKRVN